MSRTIRKDLYNLDPRRIIESGFYVRESDIADAEFAAFVDAVRARGQIDQPISVRTRAISPQERQYILVWGMRRLRAALALGLSHVPVRDFGELDETGAIRLQLQENLNRKEMTPAETAVAFWELHQRGVTGTDIARDNARTKGYVSALMNAGQVITMLTPDERRALAAPGRFRVRDAQALTTIKGIDARVEALRTMVVQPPARSADDDAASDARARGPETPDERSPEQRVPDERALHDVPAEQVSTPSDAREAGQGGDSAAPGTPARRGRGGRAPLGQPRRADEDGAFHVRLVRGGRGRVLRVRWHDDDLRAAPQEFVARFATFLREEVDHLHARLAALETASLPATTHRAEFEAAKRRALALATWLQTEGGAAG